MTNPDEELLADLLLRWEELQEEGLDTPASELVPDRPDLVPELDRRIRLLKASAWLDKPLDDDPPDDDDPGSPPAPRTLGGRYRLDELIAEGGFARVYKAYDTELQRTVASELETVFATRSYERFEQGDSKGSGDDMDEAIRREPGNPEFHEKRGFALQKLGRDDKAAAAFKKAKELSE